MELLDQAVASSFEAQKTLRGEDTRTAALTLCTFGVPYRGRACNDCISYSESFIELTLFHRKPKQ